MIPEEWQSAWAASRDLNARMHRHGVSTFKHAWFVAIPFVVGAGIGYIGADEISSWLARSALTLAGIFAGFTVTLILFTGRAEKTDGLVLEALEDYIAKVEYLLWSQIRTLNAFVLLALCCILWIVVDGSSIGAAVREWSSAALVGALALSMSRLMLLPYQIYEVHRFVLLSTLEANRRAISAQIDERRKTRNGLKAIP